MLMGIISVFVLSFSVVSRGFIFGKDYELYYRGRNVLVEKIGFLMVSISFDILDYMW